MVDRTQPEPGGNADSFLTGVQCFSASACLAVGDYINPAGKQLAMAERWEGHRWELQAMPSPTGQDLTYLTAVSCFSASTCTAVGYSQQGIADTATVAVRWNGTAWQLQSTPNVGRRGRQPSQQRVVPDRVGVHGGRELRAGPDWPVLGRALGWCWVDRDGRCQPRRRQPGRRQRQCVLSSVACPSVHACVAVGSWNGGKKSGGALVENWDGTKWAVQSTPTGGLDAVVAVSCSATAACGCDRRWIGRSVRLAVGRHGLARHLRPHQR